MIAARRYLIALFFLFCCTAVAAASYPSENQLRTAIDGVAGLLKSEGLELTVLDAQKEGLTNPLMAAGLSLENGTCLVFFNTKPADGLNQFFESVQEKDLSVWLLAIAVHEATHCVEQREAYIRKHFDRVLPRSVTNDGMTVQGYLSVVKSGVVETWGEALADIASILYLQRTRPEDWRRFSVGIATMRHNLAGKWPSHDTSEWLYKAIEQVDESPSEHDVFDAAFLLRRKLQPDN